MIENSDVGGVIPDDIRQFGYFPLTSVKRWIWTLATPLHDRNRYRAG